MKAEMTSTRYQKSIKENQAKILTLKKGSNNKKLGFKIIVKKWKKKRLYSLTLTERETCPESCHHWTDCYGNNMPFAHRFSVVGLEDKLEQDIEYLLAKHKEGIVIRLHVLGDFFNIVYVKFWEDMLLEHPKLAIFGYTAREHTKPIGKALWLLNNRYNERCVIRYSRNEESTSTESYAADESFEGDSFICPEQTGRVDNCASCGLCWIAKKTVKFLSH